MAFTGVYPVYNTILKVNKSGLNGSDDDMVQVKDTESISLKLSSKTDTWYPMDGAGWERILMTGKAISVTCKGKRSVGDPGNDYVYGVAWKDGLDCTTRGELDFPDGSKLTFNCVVDVTNPGGDDSTKAAPLEYDLKFDGKPTFVAAGSYSTLEMSSILPANNATNVTLTSNITLTFNNAISSHNIFLVNDTDDTNVAASITLDATKKIITIDPTSSFTASKKYAVVIAGVKDIYGQSLANSISYFTAVSA